MIQRFLFSFFLFIVNISWGQTGCGTSWDNEWAEEMLLRDRSYLQNHVSSRDIIHIPIHYHIVKDNNGLNGFQLSYLLQMHCELNERYSPTGIQFYIKEISSINDNNIFDFANSDLNTDINTFNTYNTKNACNVYLVKNPAGNCGYTYRPAVITTNNGGIFVSASRTSISCSGPGSTTLTHEMGHWLDLPHTFFGWEGVAAPTPTSNAPTKIAGFWNVEKVARATGANCSNSGDFFCGTPPDYFSGRWTCPTSGGTTYKDPVGATFIHDGTFYMGYADDNCQNKFSTDQMNQMNFTMKNLNQRKEILTVTLPTFIEFDSTELLSPLSGLKYPRNKIELKWKKSIDAPMYHIILIKGTSALSNNPNFDLLSTILLDTLIADTSILLNQSMFPTNVLLSNNNYYWKVKPMSYRNTCKEYSSTGNFKVSNMTADLKISNPSCFGSTDGKAEFTVNGATTTSISYFVDAIGTTTESVKDLGNGIYVMTITGSNASEIMQIPFIIEEPKEINPNFFVHNNYTLSIAPTNGSAPYVYAWSSGENTSTISVKNQTTYTVTITDAKGCITTKTMSVGYVGIEILEGDNITVDPNILSVGKDINLKLNITNPSPITIEIINELGEKISQIQTNLKFGINQINIENQLSPGVYFIKINGSGIIGKKKIIII